MDAWKEDKGTKKLVDALEEAKRNNLKRLDSEGTTAQMDQLIRCAKDFMFSEGRSPFIHPRHQLYLALRSLNFKALADDVYHNKKYRAQLEKMSA